MGRMHHLKETLPQNIRDNPATANMDVEFVVLNYNSQDDLHEWMTTDPDMKAHIESGLVRYGKTTDPEEFHHSHAKNMAHRMATGDVLCNLDADNYLGQGFAKFLNKEFSEDIDIVINPSVRMLKEAKADASGFYGRIAISKDNFTALHGYDEEFFGWGGEDPDLNRRAKGMNLKHLRIEDPEYLKVIGHSNQDRVINTVADGDTRKELNRVREIKNSSKSFLEKVFNKAKVFQYLVKPVQANPDGYFGKGLVRMENNWDLQFGKAVNEILSPFNVCALGLPELVRGRLSPRIAEDLEKSKPRDTYFVRPTSEL